MSDKPFLLPWPPEWPWFKQPCFVSWVDRCDALVGPCSCSDWHEQGFYRLVNGVVCRKGHTRDSELSNNRKPG